MSRTKLCSAAVGLVDMQWRRRREAAEARKRDAIKINGPYKNVTDWTSFFMTVQKASPAEANKHINLMFELGAGSVSWLYKQVSL